MNKFNKYLCIILTIIIFSSSAFANEQSEAKRIKSYVDYDDEITQINQVEEKADFIIKATVLPESENIIVGEVMGYTKTKLQVNKVYSGNIQEGTIIYLQ